VVEELVTNFVSSRDGLLGFARGAVRNQQDQNLMAERPRKRRRVAGDQVNGAGRRSTRSQSKRHTEQVNQSLPSTQEEVADSDEGSVYADERPAPSHTQVTEPHDGLVACPCCGRRMKETVINSHLDRCINGEGTPTPDLSSPPPINGRLAPSTIAYTQPKPAQQKERLPTINYSVLNDNALRKKLKELGIPNHGSKDSMRKRHTEWMNLWNANCDSRNPVSKSKLLHDLDIWERTLGRQADRGSTGVMIKDFDRQGYAKSNKNNFDDLIAQARAKRASALENTGRAGQDPESANRSGPDTPSTINHTEAQPQTDSALPRGQELDHSMNGAQLPNGPSLVNGHEPDHTQTATPENPNGEIVDLTSPAKTPASGPKNQDVGGKQSVGQESDGVKEHARARMFV